MTMGPGSFSGTPVRRVEDPDLLRGAGTYVDNLKIDGMLTPSSCARRWPTR